MEPIQPKYARRKFTAWRDEHGVPHVETSSWREAIYALGYLHALDRPTQMLFGRALAGGVGAERIADTPELRETDRFFRRAGLARDLPREVQNLDDDVFEQLTFYCEGINDGMRQSGRSLPMWATGFHPEPWNQEAVLLIGNLLSYGGLAVGQQQNERLLIELVQLGIEPAHLKDLFEPMLDEADFELMRDVKISHQLSDDALELLADLPRLAGSNAWAVAPWRSATGHALLASDPHLEVNRLPAIWYEAVLRWGDHFVMGATLPGCPLFAVGRTRQLAWGVTYLKGDTSDYFVEDCRPGGVTGWQYRRGDTWHDFELRTEIIQRKGDDSETLRIYENEQGTLEGDPDVHGPGRYLSIAWIGSAAGSGRSIRTWLDVVGCDSAETAMDTVRDCPQPSLVWVFADTEGHIGMQASGWFPRRRTKFSGALPIPAWNEHNHWQGRVPSSLLPRVLDPPEGFIASANENIDPPQGPQLISLVLPDYRKRRIVERLEQLNPATIEDMQRLQYDVVSLQARGLMPILLANLPEGEIKNQLANWDYAYTPTSTEATLFTTLYYNIISEIFGRESGIGWRRMFYLCTRVGYSITVLTCIDRLMRKEQSLWWRESKRDVIRRAAARIEGQLPFAPWSVTNAFHFVNRFFEPRRVGRVLGFHTGELAMPGCHATPFQGHLLRTATRATSFAPSYHFVTDLGSNEAWTNLPGGPSESRFSKWYRNDIPRWAAGEYKRLTLS